MTQDPQHQSAVDRARARLRVASGVAEDLARLVRTPRVGEQRSIDLAIAVHARTIERLVDQALEALNGHERHPLRQAAQ